MQHICLLNLILGIRWLVSPDRIEGSGVQLFEVMCFYKFSADLLMVFNWLQAQALFLGGVPFASCLW